jgi:hypothetical protein
MAYTSESDLKYIDGLDSIPTSGPDPFGDVEKLEAAARAEAKLEADVNDGKEIGVGARTTLHGSAAAAWASFLLTYGGESPQSALGGDLVDGSSADVAEFASTHKEVYQSYVASIEDSDADESSDSTDVIFSG